MRVPTGLSLIAVSWACLVLGLGVVVPLASLGAKALELAVAGGHERAGSVFFDPEVLSLAWKTAWQAGVSTACAALIGVPLGLWVGSSATGRTARWARIFLAIPYGIPTLVVCFVMVAWLGRSGLLSSWSGFSWDGLYTFQAVIAAHVFLNAPWIALAVAHSRSRTPAVILESARSLGAGRGARFRWVIWPEIRWSAAAACVHVFSLCAMSFTIVLLLGGGPPVDTLETAIYARIRLGSLDLAGAVVCAVWQALIAGVPWVVLLLLSRKNESRRYHAFAGTRSVSSRACVGSLFARSARNARLAAACSLFCLPYGVVFFQAPSGLASLMNDPASLNQVFASTLLSLHIAVRVAVVVILSAVTGVIAASVLRKSPLGSVIAAGMALPSGVSALVLGLGFWLAYRDWIDPFDGSIAALIGLQSVLFLPMAFRTLWPLTLGIQRELLEAAASLGASPWRGFWAVEWPRWKQPLFKVAAITAGASLGELAVISLFAGAGDKNTPLPLLMARWMGQYRFEEAQAIAALMLALSAGTIAAVMAVGEDGTGSPRTLKGPGG